MKIIFVLNGIEFDGDATETRPLGGTETALIGVMRALASDPSCTVEVFTNTSRPGIYDAVTFHSLQSLGPWSAHQQADVLVSVRNWVPFILPIRARVRLYWSPDAIDQPFLNYETSAQVPFPGGQQSVGLFAPFEFMHQVDAVYCVGHWQASTFVSKLNFPADKIVIQGNGHFPCNFSPLPLERRRRRLFYSSTPYRGLEHLVRYFALMRKRDAALELEVCSGMGVYGYAAEQDRAKFGRLYDDLQACGAISHGSVVQRELNRLMCAARVFAYPNTYAETFCISALEAQAAGLPVVTTRLAAMAERVTDGEDGFLIDGMPGEPAYDAAFMDRVQRLLDHDGLWTSMSQAALAKAATLTYAHLAARWRDDLDRQLARKPAQPSTPVATLSSLAGVQVTARQGGPSVKLDADFMRGVLHRQATRYGFNVG